MCVLTKTTFAQKDTLYINRSGTLVSRDSAKFFRLITKIDSSMYKVEDYFLFGKLQMTGFCTSPSGIIKTGKYTFYDSSGHVSGEGEYTKGFKSGIWNYYFKNSEKQAATSIFHYPEKGYYHKQIDSLTGKVTEEGEVDQNNKSNGLQIFYFYNSNLIWRKLNYISGLKQGEQLEYYKNGAIKRREIMKGYDVIEATQFNEDGKKIKYFPAFEYPKPPQYLVTYLSTHVKCFDSLFKSTDLHYSLIVHSDGSISDIELPDLGECLCKADIIAALARMKKWSPAKKENVPYNYSVNSILRYRSRE